MRFHFGVSLLLLYLPGAFGQPNVSATNQDSMQTDLDSDGVADPGDTIRYNVTIRNSVTATSTTQDPYTHAITAMAGTRVLLPSTTVVTSDANPSVFGQSVTLTAEVTGSGATPTGTVEFVIDGGTAIPVTLDGTGKATTSTSSLAQGPHSVVANYLGDATYSAGSDSLTQNVSAASTTITITADAPDPSIVGQDITVEWVVAVVAPGGGTPTGTVTLSDGVDSAGPFNVADALGALALTMTGNRTITATYTPDTPNYSGDSETESHQVNPVPTSLVVDLATDVNNGSLVPGDVELREAINLIAAGGTITFAPSLAGQTIVLDNTNQGPISIMRSVTIDGTGVNPTVDADGVDRVFTIEDGNAGEFPVEIVALSLTGGFFAGLGGGIFNNEDLTLTGVTIFGNSAIQGGGILSLETLSIVDSTIRDNSASGLAGGIGSAGPLVIRNSTISSNTSNQSGGIQTQDVSYIINTTVSSNRANAACGGILSVIGGPLNIINSTITNNTADFDNNGSGDGGGLYNAGVTINVQNTLIAGNFDTPNNAGTGTIEPEVHGTFVGNKTNLIGDLTGSTGFAASEDLSTLGFTPVQVLSPTLQNNGGPTFTHDLVLDGPAIDGGTDALAVDELASPLTTDQRGTGFPRIALTSVDVGALEFQCDPTSITQDPTDETLCEGGDITFTAAANGTPTPTVQWQVDDGQGGGFVDIGGETNTDLILTGVDASMNGYQYQAVFTNPCGTETTVPATLTVNTAPVVTLDPDDTVGCDGGMVTFTAQASGSPVPTIQWQVDEGAGFADIPGAMSEDLVLNPVSVSMTGFLYRAVFTNTCGTDTSAAAMLTVNQAPTITEHPQDVEGCLGGTVTFTSASIGIPAPTPQWQVDDGTGFAFISGAFGSSLTVDVTAEKDGYRYRCGWGNGCGVEFSDPATLTVTSSPSISTTKSSVFFGPFLSSNFVSATDGVFGGRVHITWSAVQDALEYRVIRAENPDLSDAQAVSGWITDTYYDDYTVEYRETQFFMCPKTIVPVLYHYFVVSRNNCFESNPSSADSGWGMPRQAGEHTQRALPAGQTQDGKQIVDRNGTLTVRLTSSEAINPDSVSGIVRADSPLDIAGVVYWPVVEGDWRDVWVSYTPLVPWQSGEVITFTVAAQTVGGRYIEPIAYGFQAAVQQSAKSGPAYQPAYASLEGEEFDHSLESMDEAALSALVAGSTPLLEGGHGAAYSIDPAGPYGLTQRVWLPVPAGVDPHNVGVHYLYTESGSMQWVLGQDMHHWLMPGSERLVVQNGVAYYGFLVMHGGIVQLGDADPESFTPMASGVVRPADQRSAVVEFLFVICAAVIAWRAARRGTLRDYA